MVGGVIVEEGVGVSVDVELGVGVIVLIGRRGTYSNCPT